MVWEAGTCRIEGSPESVLWEVPSDGAMAKGVIYLVGCAFRQVTFRNIAIASSSNGLQLWRDNCTFSEGGATSWESKDALREKVEQLKAERDALREEKRQDRQNQRRERIEQWRAFIQDFDFGTTKRFAGEDIYHQMKPYLRTEVIEMFETPRGFYVGNEAHGDSAYRQKLLEEVARIEREWGLI